MQPLLVADIGINHNGDLALAKEMICAAHLAGVDYVKFQKRTVEKCYTQEYLDRPRDSRWGTTVRAEKKGLEFDCDEYITIDELCALLHLPWFASPRDPEDVAFLTRLDMPFIKIASGSLTNQPLLDAIRETKIPVIMSTGMATPEEIDGAVRFFAESKQLKYLLHCVSLYPCPDKKVNLLAIRTLKEHYGHLCKIGYSHHGPGIAPCMAQICGAEMIEFHFTTDLTLPGPDQSASMTPYGVGALRHGLSNTERVLGDGRLGASEEEFAKGRNYRWRQKTVPSATSPQNG